MTPYKGGTHDWWCGGGGGGGDGGGGCGGDSIVKVLVVG